jgi:3-oxoacyl-[acyl-carrier protein] reductase
MNLNLTGRRALVLGGSRGLGAAIAATLAAEGATVIAAARSSTAISEWSSALPAEHGARITAMAVDLSQRSSVDDLARALIADGGVDILINNGGGPPAGTARGAPIEQWQDYFQSMAGHLFHLTSLLLDGMTERRWGRIITIASSGIEQPLPNLALSNSLRMAVLGWSKTLAAEVAAAGVTVNVLVPGRIKTDRVNELDRLSANRQGKSIETVVAESISTIPTGRYGTVQEFANVVTFLASEAASYVTGARIRVDGGLVKSV